MPRRRHRYHRSSSLPLLLIGFLFILIVYFSYHLIFDSYRLEHSIARNILTRGMPVVGEQEAHSPGWAYTYRSIIYLLTDFDLGNPKTLLESSIPLLASIEKKQVWAERPFFFVPELTFAPDPISPHQSEYNARVLSQEPAVLIYHTHSSEMYLGRQAAADNYRNSHYVFSSNIDSKITGIMEVGNHLAEALRRQGIEVIHETRIHDWPSLTSSYMNSERTVRELLNKYQTINIVFDVHRDAKIPEPIVIINGQRVAKVLIVVGTAQDIPQSHPNWQQNLQFAQGFFRLGEQMYPGLMRPMQVRRDARYNQHLHENSIVIEIGSVENTIEEALLAAELVANIAAQLL